MPKKKPETPRYQLGLTFPPQVRSLLDALLEVKQTEVGVEISLSAYVRMLVEQEAARQGIKPKKGK
jgi:hypothetical protein